MCKPMGSSKMPPAVQEELVDVTLRPLSESLKGPGDEGRS